MAKKMNMENIKSGLDAVRAITDNLIITSKNENIPTGFIKINKNNTAAENDTIDDLHDLAITIQTAGLIHPLTVNKISDTEYKLLSGERRYRAITTYLPDWDKIPCTIYDNADKTMENAITLIANLEVRQYTTEKKIALYSELEQTLMELKKSGQYKGAIQQGIADLMGVSTRQIRRYKTIDDSNKKPKADIMSASPETSINAAFVSEKTEAPNLKISQNRKIGTVTELLKTDGYINLKNSNQRKEFLDNYKAWGIWKKIPELGMKYYRYSFSDRTQFIASEYYSLDDHSELEIRNLYHIILGEDLLKKNDYTTNIYKHFSPGGNGQTIMIEYLTKHKPLVKDWRL